MRAGQLSLCSQVLLLPVGVPPRLVRARCTFSHAYDSEVRRELSTTDVGKINRVRSFKITKCYQSLVRSISRHFALVFLCFRICAVGWWG